MRRILVFDLDETVICSKHRTPSNADGSLNLPAYIANHTPENVAKDTLLPLADVMKKAYLDGHYIIVLTARDMMQCDYDFLALHGLRYHKLFSRDQAKPAHYSLKDGEYKARWIMPFLNLKQFKGKPVLMFDDAAPVKKALRGYFPVVCAIKTNAKLSRLS